jgi:hypothetical protein
MSVVLLFIAVAWYGFFGYVAPHYIYENPQSQAEVAADAMTATTALLRVIAPWVALIIADQAVVVYLRERRR